MYNRKVHYSPMVEMINYFLEWLVTWLVFFRFAARCRPGGGQVAARCRPVPIWSPGLCQIPLPIIYMYKIFTYK